MNLSENTTCLIRPLFLPKGCSDNTGFIVHVVEHTSQAEMIQSLYLCSVASDCPLTAHETGTVSFVVCRLYSDSVLSAENSGSADSEIPKYKQNMVHIYNILSDQTRNIYTINRHFTTLKKSGNMHYFLWNDTRQNQRPILLTTVKNFITIYFPCYILKFFYDFAK